MFQLQVHKSNDRYEFSAQLMTISWWSLLRAVDVYNSTSFSLMCACLKAFWEHHLIVCHKNKLVREMLDWRAATSAAAELQFNKNFYALFLSLKLVHILLWISLSRRICNRTETRWFRVCIILLFFSFYWRLCLPLSWCRRSLLGFRYVCVKCEIQLANSPKLTWGFRFTSSWYQHEKQHINSLYAVALIAFALQKSCTATAKGKRLKWGSKTQSESPTGLDGGFCPYRQCRSASQHSVWWEESCRA